MGEPLRIVSEILASSASEVHERIRGYTGARFESVFADAVRVARSRGLKEERVMMLAAQAVIVAELRRVEQGLMVRSVSLRTASIPIGQNIAIAGEQPDEDEVSAEFARNEPFGGPEAPTRSGSGKGGKT